MTQDDFENMLRTLAKAWTARDYEKAIACFAADVRYADPLRYRFNNSDDLLKFFQDDGGFFQRTVWHNILFDEDQQSGAAEYSYQGTHLYHGVTLIKVQADKISHWREYQHIADTEWEVFSAGTAFVSARYDRRRE